MERVSATGNGTNNFEASHRCIAHNLQEKVGPMELCGAQTKNPMGERFHGVGAAESRKTLLNAYVAEKMGCLGIHPLQATTKPPLGDSQEV